MEEDVRLALDAGGWFMVCGARWRVHGGGYMVHGARCTVHGAPPGYPPHLEFKLYERRARARRALGRPGAAGDATAALGALAAARLDQAKVEERRRELEELLHQLEQEGVQEVVEEARAEEPRLPGENPKFPTFSDAVRIK